MADKTRGRPKTDQSAQPGKGAHATGHRRTFQDLARAAEVKDVVTRAVSGHATEVMQRHYSTVNGQEIREGIARVISLAKFQEAMTASPKAGQGDSGMHGPEMKKAS